MRYERAVQNKSERASERGLEVPSSESSDKVSIHKSLS